jgi:hypothetical protein
MKVRKLFAVMLFTAMTVGMLAGPAAATHTPADVVGAVNAKAVVGKVSYDAGCTTDPSGGGIGLPVVNGLKNAFYRFSGPATSAQHGAGMLVVCGKLMPELSAVGGGLGAACGASKGYDGFGTADFANNTGDMALSEIEWKASAGSFFIVTGKATNAAGTFGVLSLVSAKGTGT